MSSHINSILDVVKFPVRNLIGDKSHRAASAVSDAPSKGRSSAEQKRATAERKELDKEEKEVRRELCKLAKEREVAEKHVLSHSRSLHAVTYQWFAI